MMTKKTKYLAGSVFALVAVIALLAAAILPASTSGSTNTIRANVIKDCSGTPWFVAVQKGYFENGGINFVDKGSLDWSLQATALISGQSDVFDGHPNTLINLLVYGVKVHAVALSTIERPDTTSSNETMHWLVMDSSVFKTVKDLVANGYKPKIGSSSPSMCMDLEANGWFAANDVSMSDFDFEVIPDPQLETALRQGQIDVAILPQAFYTAVEQRGEVRIIAESSNPFGSNAETSLLIFRDGFVASHPDTVRAFIIAYKNAERWSNDHQYESALLTANTIGVENVTTHWYSYTGEITDNILQPWIDAMVEAGSLSKGQIKASDLYTTQYSDLWVNETSPQPIDPVKSSTVAGGGDTILVHYGGMAETARKDH